MNCPLCDARASQFFSDPRSGQQYFSCPQCHLKFLDPTQRLTHFEEKERYDLHRNNLADPDYIAYVKPLADAIKSRLAPLSHGLDFGCGLTPIMSHLLEAEGFTMTRFDPYFCNEPKALEIKYDFIVASEVAEHFFEPQKEFEKLRDLLRPNGVLGLMTSLTDDIKDFSTWHYRRDPTHVCFFSSQTLEWVRERFGFSRVEIQGPRTIILDLKSI